MTGQEHPGGGGTRIQIFHSSKSSSNHPTTAGDKQRIPHLALSTLRHCNEYTCLGSCSTSAYQWEHYMGWSLGWYVTYQPNAMVSGLENVELCENHQSPVLLVITDCSVQLTVCSTVIFIRNIAFSGLRLISASFFLLFLFTKASIFSTAFLVLLLFTWGRSI